MHFHYPDPNYSSPLQSVQHMRLFCSEMRLTAHCVLPPLLIDLLARLMLATSLQRHSIDLGPCGYIEVLGPLHCLKFHLINSIVIIKLRVCIKM